MVVFVLKESKTVFCLAHFSIGNIFDNKPAFEK